ncbi:hypothetical protein G7Y89_g1430 [Cudoniella acicularis]|uniref:Alpha/beta hydrolase fold-3 domain-containing protein n=1 Tax=Cudoniella acicularis TaxID=354080 RepID=A0A8H4RWD6_9HELO|nr:hypothetical protein G7Y89_g1430 [Cudoniella acicularis]
MPLKSDIVIDAAKFDPANNSEQSKKVNQGLIERLNLGPQWHEVGAANYRQMRWDGKTAFPAPTVLPDGLGIKIPSREPGRDIPCRLVYPKTRSTAEERKGCKGVVMHIHGGGWTLGNEKSQDTLLQYYADSGDLAVVSLGYQLAPENPFPKGPEDCMDAGEYLVKNSENEYGGPLKFIGGESAGAHLSLIAIFHILKTYPDFRLTGGLLLHFGCYDLTKLPAQRNMPLAAIIPSSVSSKFLDAFLPDMPLDAKKAPTVSPYYEDLIPLRGKLPNALFTCGTEDPLIDDSVVMGAKWAIKSPVTSSHSAALRLLSAMSITFGSVGDILSVCLLVKDLVLALDESRGSATEYREVIRELWGLDRALLEVDLLARSCESTVELSALFNTARKAADDCRICIDAFSKKIKKYGASLGEGRSRNILKDTARKIQWMTKKDDLDRFRAEVNAHSLSINMLLATASVNILKVNDVKLNARLTESDETSKTQGSLIIEVRDRLEENNRLISAGNTIATKIAEKLRLDWLQQLGSELKSLMERIFVINVATYKAVIAQASGFPSALERTLVQEPFLLEDAIGRISPVHMQFISSWEAFDAVLELRFHKLQGHKKVINKEYVIQEHATRREIRRDLPWEVSFLPGQRVDMSLIFEKQEKGSTNNKSTQTTCPRCHTASTACQDSDIQCTSCNMWYRRITEYQDTEPAPLNIPPLRRNTKAAFGQHGFASVVLFGPQKPQNGATGSATKRKLSETELEDTQDVSFFKRVRVVSKRQRIKYVPGPFARHNAVAGDSILDPKAKQKAEAREARKLFEDTAARLGMNHTNTIGKLNALALCLRNQRRFKEAEDLLRAAFTSSRDILISEDPTTLQLIASNLMTVLVDQDKTVESGEIWNITKTLLRSNLPDDLANELIGKLKLVQVFHTKLEDEPVAGSSRNLWGHQGTESFPALNDSIALMRMPLAQETSIIHQTEPEPHQSKWKKGFHRPPVRTALLQAVANGDPASVHKLISDGANVNISHPSTGDTALHIAIWNSTQEISRILLENGAIIEAENKQGSTALHCSVIGNRTQAAELLLEKGANINATNKEGWSALLYAADRGFEAMAQFLINKGADINASTKSGMRALHYATQKGYESIVQILIGNGANINASYKYGMPALHCATKNGYEKIVRKLIDNKADINSTCENGLRPLHHATKSGHEVILQILIDKGADIDQTDSQGWTALHLGILCGRKGVVDLLIRNGANMQSRTKNGETAFHKAVEYGEEAIVRLLLDKGMNIEQNSERSSMLLHLAVENKYWAIVELLLDKGANVNEVDTDKSTLLHRAASLGGGVQLLLDHGADIHAMNKNGETALYLAVCKGLATTASLLLDAGADIEAKDLSGYTALHRAAFLGKEGMVRLLLERRANIHTTCWRRKTPLHSAVEQERSGREGVVRLLLEKGASIVAVDRAGHTPLSYARIFAMRKGYDSVAKLLLERRSHPY